MRAALVRDGHVDNVVLVDPDVDYDPGEGVEVVPLDDDPVGPGWTRSADGWVAPDLPEQASDVASERLDELAVQAGKATSVAALRDVVTGLIDELRGRPDAS